MKTLLNDVIDLLDNELKTDFPELTILRGFQPVTLTCPTVIVEETKNEIDSVSSTLTEMEVLSELMYEIHIYTDGYEKSLKSTEIAFKINDVLSKEGYKRTYASVEQNFVNLEVYKYVMFYEITI